MQDFILLKYSKINKKLAKEFIKLLPHIFTKNIVANSLTNASHLLLRLSEADVSYGVIYLKLDKLCTQSNSMKTFINTVLRPTIQGLYTIGFRSNPEALATLVDSFTSAQNHPQRANNNTTTKTIVSNSVPETITDQFQAAQKIS